MARIAQVLNMWDDWTILATGVAGAIVHLGEITKEFTSGCVCWVGERGKPSLTHQWAIIVLEYEDDIGFLQL